MPCRAVSKLADADFFSETLRIGDLNEDGAPDLLFAQSVFGTREITCLTAITIAGQILWQQGMPCGDNGRIYSDLPVQVHDWDGDGHNEVLWVEQAFYADPVVWDCATGKEVPTPSFSPPIGTVPTIAPCSSTI